MGETYTLHADDEAALSREGRKGCGMLVVAFFLVALAVVALPPSRYLLPEFLGVVAMLLAVRAFSVRLSGARLALARRHYRKRRHERVLALLAPFVERRGNARFDRSGEAHYLLFKAATALGETEIAEKARGHLARTRRGKRL